MNHRLTLTAHMFCLVQHMLNECKTGYQPPEPGQGQEDVSSQEKFPVSPEVMTPGRMYPNATEALSHHTKYKTPSVFERLCNAGQATRNKLEQQSDLKKSLNQSKSSSSRLDSQAAAAPALSESRGEVVPTQVVEKKKNKGPVKTPLATRLMQEERERQMRLGELQAAGERDELATIKDRPTITKRAKELQRHGDVADRLFEYGKQRDKRREALAESAHREEMETLKANPTITARARHTKRHVKDMQRWEDQRKAKIEKAREQQSAITNETVQAGPRISRNSERLVKNMNRTRDIGDHLNAQAQVSERRKKILRDKKIKEEKQQHIPTISVHSASLRREGKVGDRLYGEWLEREQKKQEEALDRAWEEAHKEPKLAIHPSTNKRGKDKGAKDDLPVGERLYQKGKEYKKKAAALRAAEERAKENQQPSAPGAYSQLLVELMEKRTNTTSAERLQRPTRRLKQSTVADLEEEEMNCTFQPHINRTSRMIDSAANSDQLEPGQKRRDLLFQRAEEYEFKRARMQEAYLKQEMAHCTFSPQVSHREAAGPREGGNVVQRSMEWLKQKESRAEEKKRIADEKEMRECTFGASNSRGRGPSSRGSSAPRSTRRPSPARGASREYQSKSPARGARRHAWGSPGSPDDWGPEFDDVGGEEDLDAEAEDWLHRVVGTAQGTLA